MKIWRLGMLGYLPVAGLAMLLVFSISGCEGTTDEDSSGVDDYLAAHPYTSAPRDTPLNPVLQISPVQVIVSIVGQTIAFTASGGDGVFHWGLSYAANGKIESKGAGSALYTCLAVENNDVIVQDDGGYYATAHIYKYTMTNSLAVSPASVSLSGGALNASFTVSGGTSPYSWTSGNTALGTVSYSASSSYVASYTAVAGAYGQNVVTVIDVNGLMASATVTQTE